MLLLNGHLLPDDALTLPLPNRGLLYGDGFFETLIVEQGRLRLAADHLARMQRAAVALHLELPAALATAEGLGSALAALAAANNLASARLRLKLWREGGGLYTPLSSGAEWLATATAFQENNAPIEQADFARDTYSVASPLSFCKGPQAWLYVRAAHEQQQRGLGEILLCDAAGHVAEAGAAAIFWLKAGVLYTPALATGCVAGVRRAALLRAAPALGLQVREGLFAPAELLAAEAAFTANVAGVRPLRRLAGTALAPPPAELLATLVRLG